MGVTLPYGHVKLISNWKSMLFSYFLSKFYCRDKLRVSILDWYGISLFALGSEMKSFDVPQRESKSAPKVQTLRLQASVKIGFLTGH